MPANFDLTYIRIGSIPAIFLSIIINTLSRLTTCNFHTKPDELNKILLLLK